GLDGVFSASSTPSVHWVMDNLCCASCSAPLQPEDGHDMCPPCLGVDHLREALSDHACVLPRAVRLARLSSVEQPVDWTVSVQQDPLPLGQGAASTKRSAEDVPLASGRRAKRHGPPGLSSRVDQLSTELARMKALLQSLGADGGRSESSPPEQGGMMLFRLRSQAPSFERPFRNWAPGPEVPPWEVWGNRCLQLLKQLWAVCSWTFPWPSLLHLAPSLGAVMPRLPLLFLPQRSTSRSCMLAGRTQGPFPARQRMAGPWLPCTRRPSSGWAACPLSSLPLPPSSFLPMRR
ncbi:hypothetical protein GOODEAATRI_033562, partial [Goodea atripinnis]